MRSQPSRVSMLGECRRWATWALASRTSWRRVSAFQRQPQHALATSTVETNMASVKSKTKRIRRARAAKIADRAKALHKLHFEPKMETH